MVRVRVGVGVGVSLLEVPDVAHALVEVEKAGDLRASSGQSDVGGGSGELNYA